MLGFAYNQKTNPRRTGAGRADHDQGALGYERDGSFNSRLPLTGSPLMRASPLRPSACPRMRSVSATVIMGIYTIPPRLPRS